MRRDAFCLVAVVGAIAACGARTGLGAPRALDAGSDACAAPTCADETRGTWRFTTSQGTTGYFFLFDGSQSCNGSVDDFMLVVGACSRNGDYVIQNQSATSLTGSSDNMGGSFDTACGGDPTNETLGFTTTRHACDAATYDLTVQDSVAQSPFAVDAVMTRCRCDLGWTPCVDPMPADPCAP